MKLDDAIGQIRDFTPLSDADVRALLNPALSYEDLALLVRTYRDAGAVTELSTWQRIEQVVSEVGEFAGKVLPILSVAMIAAPLL